MSFPMMNSADKSYLLVAISFAFIHDAGDLGHQGGTGADCNMRLSIECSPFRGCVSRSSSRVTRLKLTLPPKHAKARKYSGSNQRSANSHAVLRATYGVFPDLLLKLVLEIPYLRLTRLSTTNDYVCRIWKNRSIYRLQHQIRQSRVIVLRRPRQMIPQRQRGAETH